MPVSKKVDDGRSANKRSTTERISIDMGGRALTLWRWTEKAKSTGKNWQVRCAFDGKTFQISTGEEDIKKAREFAKSWYGGFISRKGMGIPIENNPEKLDILAEKYFETCRKLAEKGVRHRNFSKDKEIRYKNYISPFLGKDLVHQITTQRIYSWLKWRERTRVQTINLPAGEIKREVEIIRGILNEGVSLGLIDDLPKFPPSLKIAMMITKQTNTRTYFNSKQVIQIIESASKRILEAEQYILNPTEKGGNWTKIRNDREYLYHYIIWLAGTGMRPEEVQKIKLKDINQYPEKDKNKSFLSINVKGKTGDRKVVARNYVYKTFIKMLDYSNWKDMKPDDVLFPRSPSTGFNALLNELQLKTDSNGNKRDAKSLRHYYISQAIANGQDIFKISIQVGVSPDVIKKHYASHMTSIQFKDEWIDNGINKLL